jgi:hypothetical protein
MAKHRAWRQEQLSQEIHAVLSAGLSEREIKAQAEWLLGLAA